MDLKKIIEGTATEFTWLNEPDDIHFEDGLVFNTRPNTDFWQRTHYGFKRDDGHCLLTEIKEDFSLQALLEFKSYKQYDQCGIIVRIDSENWIKASIEYEDEQISRLGSVATNLGYSDWATTDISTDITAMWYRIKRSHQDFIIEHSMNGIDWKQMRVLHLHKNAETVWAGIYACSPNESRLTCKVKKIIIE